MLTTRRRLAGHLLRLPIAEYDRRRTGDLLSRVGADTTLLRAVVTSGLFEIVTGAVMVAGAIVAMAMLDPLLLGVTLVGLVVGLSVAISVSRRVRGLSEQAQARLGEMTSAVERAISAARTIRASGAEQREAETVGRSASEAYLAGRPGGQAPGDGPARVGGRDPGRLPARARASAGPGWRPARSPWAAWCPSSSSCSSWCCRSARRSTPIPSCRPGWARCSGSRRSWGCPPRRTGIHRVRGKRRTRPPR